MAGGSDPRLNANANGGGNGTEGNNYQYNVHGHGECPNNNGGGGAVLTDNTLCDRCSGDYFVNIVNPVNPHVNYIRTFPTGYRFAPSDVELIQQYLIRKIKGLELPPNNINWVTIYAYHPASLIDEYRIYGEKVWYFFTPRDRKYPNGIRPDRSVGPPGADTIVGYWKATGRDTPIEMPKGTVIGYKKALVFYEKNATRQKKRRKKTNCKKKTDCKEKTDGKKKTNSGKKTDWIMHEYRTVNEEEENRKKGKVFRVPNKKNGEVDEEQINWQLKDCVLCRIYQKASKDSTLFETPIQRDERVSLAVDSRNGDDGEVAGISSPTAPGGISVANTPLSSLINGTGANTGNFSSTLVDSPFPLPTLPGHLYSSNHQQQHLQQPSNFSNLNHQQQHMPQPSYLHNLNQQQQHLPQPPNTCYNSNQQQQYMQQHLQQHMPQHPFASYNSNHLQQHMPQPPFASYNSNHLQQHIPQSPNTSHNSNQQQHPHVQQPINVYSSNRLHQMETLPQQLVQHQELQNFSEFDWSSRNLEICESSYSSTSISDFSPHDISTSFPPPNHHLHDPSIVNEDHMHPGFGFPYEDPIIESHQANLLIHALPLGVNDDYEVIYPSSSIMATDEQPCNGTAAGGGDDEEGDNHHDKADHDADVANIGLNIAVCHRCHRDYFVNNGKPANNDVDYLGTFPVGYRFSPTDEELLEQYLLNKIRNLNLPPNNIVIKNIYEYHPALLTNKYSKYGERVWYFFSTRDRKYLNGIRPNRAAGETSETGDKQRVGFWKATGVDKQIKIPKGPSGRVVGFRKGLVFYEGSAPREATKTNWIMQEFRAVNKEEEDRKKGKKVVRVDKKKAGAGREHMRLADYVLCRIYRKKHSKDSTRRKRAASEGHEINSNNGDDGDDQGVVVSTRSPPIQQNKRMRSSSVPDCAINNVAASSTPSTSFIAQLGNHQDGMVNNSNGIYGNNSTGNNLSPMVIDDSPYPLRSLHRPPSDFCGINHQKHPMQPPSNNFLNSNPQQQHMPQAQQHQQVQQSSNSYHSNQQPGQMEITQVLAQHQRQLEFQNLPFDSSGNNGYSSDLEIGHYSSAQAHYPHSHQHPWTTATYNSAAPCNHNPNDQDVVYPNFLPPNYHQPHPSINNGDGMPPSFGSHSHDYDPDLASTAASLVAPHLDPVHEFLLEAFRYELNGAEGEKTDEEAEKSS
ncbi:hypothetical protein Sjap_013305 [Stephania japonica]|uniref:NAC domain-containing protein n=1 Tax=Stephania japonica TaxID=461633 RepID=A0AAP0IXV2_9MAGN